MKKVIYFLIVVALSFFPLLSSGASTEKKSSTEVTKLPDSEVKGLLRKIEKFNTVDRSTLAASDKKTTQAEVRMRNHRHNGGVIYISAGTLLVVLLILLLV